MARRVSIVGGLVLAAGLLLGWLGKGFFGLGEGSGLGTGGADTSQVRVESPPSIDLGEPPNRNNARPVSDRSETDEPGDVAEGVVEVVIDGERYLVRQPAGSEPAYAPVELDELVARIREAEGNSAGVRVRISRRGTSIPVAEEKLEQSLLKADVPRTSVVWVDETAP